MNLLLLCIELAIEKMMLLRASGSSDRLNDFIIRLFGADDFCPEDALSFLSSSMGYVALNEASPFEFTLRDIEDTASREQRSTKTVCQTFSAPTERRIKIIWLGSTSTLKCQTS